MKSNFVPFFSLVCLTLLLSGCGPKKPEGFPRLYATTIILEQENVPLEGATVILYSEDSTSRWVCAGRSDAQGKATIFTHSKFIGAPAGKFKVCVTKSEVDKEAEKAMQQIVAGPTPDMAQGKKLDRRSIQKKRYDYVEKIYGDLATTPLQIEVTKGSNTIPLDIGKKVKIETIVKF